MPWYNWASDFGGGTNNGVSSSASKGAIGSKLNAAGTAGMRNIRWWMFPGDAWQITRDASGKPTGLHPNVYKDIDAALALAADADVYFTFVFFSAPSHIPQSWLTNADHQRALADVLGGLAARYKTNNRVLAWEIINEPEWDVWNGKAGQAPVQGLVRSVAAALNGAGPAHVTVGSAMLDGLPMWKGLGLDFYQVHWYDYMASGQWCARCTDYATVRDRYGLDAPLVIGEFYAAPGSGATARFDDMYTKGYAGAWAWSLFSERTDDRMAIDMAAAKSFADKRTDDGPGGSGSSAPAPTATPSRTATATATATPSRTGTTAPTVTTTPTRTPTPAATQTPRRRWYQPRSSDLPLAPASETPAATSTPSRRLTAGLVPASTEFLVIDPAEWVCDVSPGEPMSS